MPTGSQRPMLPVAAPMPAPMPAPRARPTPMAGAGAFFDSGAMSVMRSPWLTVLSVTLRPTVRWCQPLGQPGERDSDQAGDEADPSEDDDFERPEVVRCGIAGGLDHHAGEDGEREAHRHGQPGGGEARADEERGDERDGAPEQEQQA